MIKIEDGVVVFKKGKPYGLGRKAYQLVRDYIYFCSETKRTPYLEEVALLMGVSEKTLKEWGEAEEKFEDLLNNLLTMQKLDMKRKSISGSYNSKIVSLILSAEHNVVERIKKEVGGPDGEAIKIEQQFNPEQEDLIRKGIQDIVESVTM